MAGAVNAIYAVGQHDEFAMPDGSLPWRGCASLQAEARRDMEHFKRLTAGCAVVMGYGTWRTLPHPLKGRVNVVIDRSAPNAANNSTKDKATLTDDREFYFYPTLEGALDLLRTLPRQVFLIGGKRLFEYAFSKRLVDGVVYQTLFDAAFPQAAVFFSLPEGLVLAKSESAGALTFSEYKVARR